LFLLDLRHLSDDERHTLVEQRLLRADEVLGTLAAHRDVHESRLVDVTAGRIDHHDLDLTGVDPPSELLRQQVRGERPPHATAQDQDPFHLVPTASSRR